MCDISEWKRSVLRVICVYVCVCMYVYVWVCVCVRVRGRVWIEEDLKG